MRATLLKCHNSLNALRTCSCGLRKEFLCCGSESSCQTDSVWILCLYKQLAAVGSPLVIQNTHFSINSSKLLSDTCFISVL